MSSQRGNCQPVSTSQEEVPQERTVNRQNVSINHNSRETDRRAQTTNYGSDSEKEDEDTEQEKTRNESERGSESSDDSFDGLVIAGDDNDRVRKAENYRVRFASTTDLVVDRYKKQAWLLHVDHSCRRVVSKERGSSTRQLVSFSDLNNNTLNNSTVLFVELSGNAASRRHRTSSTTLPPVDELCEACDLQNCLPCGALLASYQLVGVPMAALEDMFGATAMRSVPPLTIEGPTSDASPAFLSATTTRPNKKILQCLQQVTFRCYVCGVDINALSETHDVSHSALRNGTASAVLSDLLTHACILRGGAVATALGQITSMGRQELADIQRNVDTAPARARYTNEELIRLLGGSQPSPTGPVPQSPNQLSQPRLLLFWDYDNIVPRKFMTTCVQLYNNIVDSLSRQYGRGGTLKVERAVAYLSPPSVQSSTVVGSVAKETSDIDRLETIGFECRVVGLKREAADRAIVADMTEELLRLSDPARMAHLAASTHVVVVSSDKDFNSIRGRFKTLGCLVHTVHNAPPGSEHEEILKASSTTTMRVTDLVASISSSRPRISSGQVDVGGEPIDKLWLLETPAVLALLQDPGLRGEWCRRQDVHDEARCPCIHRRKTVVVGSAPMPIAVLAPNSALFFLLERPSARGTICTKTAAHSARTCGFLHLAEDMTPAEVDGGRALCVEGTDVPLQIMIRNDGVTLGLAAPGTTLRKCTITTTHDADRCRFVHLVAAGDGEEAKQSCAPWRALVAATPAKQLQPPPAAAVPQCVLIDGKQVSVAELVPNAALVFLARHPKSSSKWCTNGAPHDAMACTYIHVRDDAQSVEVDGVRVNKAAVIRDFAMRHKFIPDAMRRGESVTEAVTVNVDGASISVNDLAPSASVDFLLAHPNASGKFCTTLYDDNHDIAACRFVHLREHKRIVVGGQPVPVEDVVRNNAVRYLATHPSVGGKWCTQQPRCAAPHLCPRVHPVPRELSITAKPFVPFGATYQSEGSVGWSGAR